VAIAVSIIFNDDSVMSSGFISLLLWKRFAVAGVSDQDTKEVTLLFQPNRKSESWLSDVEQECDL
jgi:hypothetical protein